MSPNRSHGLDVSRLTGSVRGESRFDISLLSYLESIDILQTDHTLRRGWIQPLHFVKRAITSVLLVEQCLIIYI